MTTRELATIAGGIVLAIFLFPIGGEQAFLVVGLIALLVVFDLWRGRRKAERTPKG